MVKVNKNYSKLKASYLFAEIGKRTREFQAENPDVELIKLGIGDVTKPLVPKVIEALHEAADDMGASETFKGYGPETGYEFLRDLVAKNDYNDRGLDITADEIIISDGAKSDTANITELFDVDNKVAICDPVYPVYFDTNVMCGRGDNIVIMKCTPENDLMPQIPEEPVDIIYLCFPNNPTGVTASKEYLQKWVDYALKNQSIILFDSAYEAFIRTEGVPKSIYEIEGAKKCAIEFRSFSKTAGFTGLRCAYTVVPNDLVIDGQSIHDMWVRRQSTKFNGAPYIVQKAAAAVYSEEGKKQTTEAIDYYLKNAQYMKETLEGLGLKVYGGENGPYVWVQTPNNMDSWDFFDIILKKAGVISTPGGGFGECGDNFIRFSAFNTFENTKAAMERFKEVL